MASGRGVACLPNWVLHEYRESVGPEEFKRVFAQYFAPENRLVAEVAIDNHRLLIWDLREGAMRLAGQYFVEVDGRVEYGGDEIVVGGGK